MLKSVVLPAPLGPISPRISPSASVKLTSETATSPPKRLVTPLTSSKAVIQSPSQSAARSDRASQSSRREQIAPPPAAVPRRSPDESWTVSERLIDRSAAFRKGLHPAQRLSLCLCRRASAS